MEQQPQQQRVWSSDTAPTSYHTPLNHGQQHPSQAYHPSDPNSTYSVTQDMAQSLPQPKRQRIFPPEQHSSLGASPNNSSTLPHHQGPQGNPYPPPHSTAPPAEGAPLVKTPARAHVGRRVKDEPYAPNAAELYNHAQVTHGASPSPGPSSDPGMAAGGLGGNHYPSESANSVPRLPPILQVEKQQVTTSATMQASASRRRNEAHFVCPVPGCGSTFTRRFNLRGHLRSHTEERPYVCDVCKKGFARQHDCKRHQALHGSSVKGNICQGCKKPFSRMDALNRHLRSEGSAECRQIIARTAGAARPKSVSGEDSDTQSNKVV